MFTGIIEEVGEVVGLAHDGDSAVLTIRASTVGEDIRHGASIAVDGVCLTVIGWDSHDGRVEVGFDVMGETLKRSSLASVVPGTKVNLERSVRLEDRLGGHLVQGHVDDVAAIVGRAPQEHWEVVRVSLPPGLARYVVHKGSITVDGISLTVSAIGEDWFEISLIPETLKRTTLGFKQPGELVNLEVDVIAKYVEKLIGGGR